MITITQYRWAGKWGPFKIKSKCNECDLTWAMLQSMKGKEFKGRKIIIEQKPWLGNVWRCIFKGAFMPPIVVVNGRKFHQYKPWDKLFEREGLAKHIQNLAKRI